MIYVARFSVICWYQSDGNQFGNISICKMRIQECGEISCKDYCYSTWSGSWFFEKPETFGEPIADLHLLHYEGRFYFAKLHNKNPQFFLLILLIFPSLFRCSLWSLWRNVWSWGTYRLWVPYLVGNGCCLRSPGIYYSPINPLVQILCIVMVYWTDLTISGLQEQRCGTSDMGICATYERVKPTWISIVNLGLLYYRSHI